MSGQERRDSSFIATIMALLMVVTSLSPLAMAENVGDDDLESYVGDLSGFDPITEGKEYLFSESLIPIYSATGFLKSQWRSDGYPDLTLPFSDSHINSRSSTRSCENAWSVGDTDDVTTAGGSIAATCLLYTSPSPRD